MPTLPVSPVPTRRKPLVLAVGAALAALAFPAAQACIPDGSSETFVVNTLVDLAERVDGELSFRQAVADADANPGCDRVIFDPSLNGGTIQVLSSISSGFIAATVEDLSIEGPGSGLLTIDLSDQGSSSYNTLNGRGVDLSISGLTVTGSSGSSTSAIGNVAALAGGLLTLDDIVSTGGYRGIYASNLDTLTIRNSTISGNQGAFNGGGIEIFNTATVLIEDSGISDNIADRSGGGIYIGTFSATSTIEIVDTVISGNHAEATTDDSGGGGIHVRNVSGGNASLTLSGTTIDSNTTDRNGGGIFFHGTSENLNELVIEDSVVSGNTANLADIAEGSSGTFFSGGGVYVDVIGADLTVIRSSIRDNNSSSGAGIDFTAASGPMNITITDSTVSGNNADGVQEGAHGGGLRARGGAPSGEIIITQSTFSGNNTDEVGGGIFISGPTGTIEIRHSTITNNTNNQSNAAAGITSSQSVLLDHTIVAGNGQDPDIGGTYVANYSLIGNPGFATIPIANNIFGIDPANLGLGPLVDSPGPSPTQVHMPVSTSPVVDAGDPDLVAGEEETPAFDQAGRPRIVNGRIDIGAVEFSPNNAPVLDSPIPSETVRVGQAFNLDLDDYFSDPDGDSLTYEILNPGEIPDGIDLTGSIVSGTFTADDIGTYTIAYRACDTEPLCTEGSGELIITPAGGGGGGGNLGGLSLVALLSLVGLRRLSGRRGRLKP